VTAGVSLPETGHDGPDKAGKGRNRGETTPDRSTKGQFHNRWSTGT